jgi:hypothetical protein
MAIAVSGRLCSLSLGTPLGSLVCYQIVAHGSFGASLLIWRRFPSSAG